MLRSKLPRRVSDFKLLWNQSSEKRKEKVAEVPKIATVVKYEAEADIVVSSSISASELLII